MNFIPARTPSEVTNRRKAWVGLPTIKKLDIVISRACNLSCQGCVTFSQFEHIKGVIRWEEQCDDIYAWLDKLQVEDTICLFGGEPFLNPDLHIYIDKICEYLANQYRETMLFIQTNGIRLLDRPEIAELYKTPEIAKRLHIDVSIHTSNKQAVDRIYKGVEYYKNIINDTITEDSNHSGISVTDYVGNKWIKHYDVIEGRVVPNSEFDSMNYHQHHQWCHIKNFVNLYQGKLYKCPPMAVLEDYLNSLPEFDSRWNDWLAYKPCGLEDNFEEWYLTQRQPEQVCNMCFKRTGEDYEIDHDAELKYPIK